MSRVFGMDGTLHLPPRHHWICTMPVRKHSIAPYMHSITSHWGIDILSYGMNEVEVFVFLKRLIHCDTSLYSAAFSDNLWYCRWKFSRGQTPISMVLGRDVVLVLNVSVSRRSRDVFLERLVSVLKVNVSVSSRSLRVWKNRTSRSRLGLEGSTSRSRLGLVLNVLWTSLHFTVIEPARGRQRLSAIDSSYI